MLEKSMKQAEPYSPAQDPAQANPGIPVDPSMMGGGAPGANAAAGVPQAGEPGLM